MMAVASKMLGGTVAKRTDSSPSDDDGVRGGSKVERQFRWMERTRHRVRDGDRKLVSEFETPQKGGLLVFSDPPLPLAGKWESVR